MTVVFIDYGPTAKKQWHDLWAPADIVLGSKSIEAGLRCGMIEAPVTRLIVHHAADAYAWETLQKAIAEALTAGRAPPFALRVSAVPRIRGDSLCSGWTCLSKVPLRNYSPLKAYRARFHNLVAALSALGSNPQPEELAQAWSQWNVDHPGSSLETMSWLEAGSTPPPPLPSDQELGNTLVALSDLASRAAGSSASGTGTIDASGWWRTMGFDAAKSAELSEGLLQLLERKRKSLSACANPAGAKACALIASLIRQVQLGEVDRQLTQDAHAAIATNFNLIYNA